MMDQSYMQLKPNIGKNLLIDTSDGKYARFPVKTCVIKSGDDLKDILNTYVKPHLQQGDAVYISEKVVAISQGRAFPVDSIKPSRLANFLVKFVYKSPYGIGLGSPQTMELAIRDVGAPLIIFAAICAAVTKIFGVRGVFYRIVGPRGRAVDGPCEYTLPPYNNYAKMAPKDPDKVARSLSDHLGGHEVVIMDANDLGQELLGKSHKHIKADQLRERFSDNPLDQDSQQTPVAILRKVSDDINESDFICDNVIDIANAYTETSSNDSATSNENIK